MNLPFKKRHTLRRVVFHKSDLEQSLEGIWDGTIVGGHYPLQFPKLLMPGGQERSLEGSLLIPASTVVFVQILAEDAAIQ